MATQSKYVQAEAGTQNWTNGVNATGVPDASCAESGTDEQENEFDFTGDVFTIPGGSTINGIEVVVVSAADDSDDDYDIALLDPNSVYTAAKLGANSDGTACANAAADAALGGAVDDWSPGTAWTVTWLNSTNFRVRLRQQKQGKGGTTYVDSIYVTIHYTLGATTYDRSVLLDVLLQTPGVARSVDLDTVLKAEGVARSVDFDVALKKLDIPKSVLLDLLIKLRAQRSVDLDTALQKLGIPRSVDLDVALKKLDIPKSVLLDLLIKLRAERTVLLDVALQKLGIPRSVDLDTALQKLGIPRTVDLDVALQKLGIPRSVDLDTALKKTGIPRSVLLDVYLQVAGLTTYERTVLLDTLLKALGVNRTVDLDVALQKTGISRSVLLDVYITEAPVEEAIRLPIEGQIRRRRRRRPRPRPELGSFTREIGVTIYEELIKAWPFLIRIWEIDEWSAGLLQLVYDLGSVELEAFTQTVYETEQLEAEFIPYQLLGIFEDLEESREQIEESREFKAKLEKISKMRKLRRELTAKR